MINGNRQHVLVHFFFYIYSILLRCALQTASTVKQK